MFQKKNLEGEVILKFVINRLGYIENIHVVKEAEGCKRCGDVAIDIVSKMPRWKPAKSKGKPIKLYFTLPFKFHTN